MKDYSVIAAYRPRYGDRRNRAESLGSTISRLTKPFFVRRGLADGKIAREWTEIVGPMIARHSQPDRITYQNSKRQNGLLHLRVDHSAMATELQHLEPLLLERINRYFGFKAVAKMRFIHGPLSKTPFDKRAIKTRQAKTQNPAINEAVKRITDQELRDALNRLSNAVYQDETNGE